MEISSGSHAEVYRGAIGSDKVKIVEKDTDRKDTSVVISPAFIVYFCTDCWLIVLSQFGKAYFQLSH